MYAELEKIFLSLLGLIFKKDAINNAGQAAKMLKTMAIR